MIFWYASPSHCGAVLRLTEETKVYVQKYLCSIFWADTCNTLGGFYWASWPCIINWGAWCRAFQNADIRFDIFNHTCHYPCQEELNLCLTWKFLKLVISTWCERQWYSPCSRPMTLFQKDGKKEISLKQEKIQDLYTHSFGIFSITYLELS